MAPSASVCVCGGKGKGKGGKEGKVDGGKLSFEGETPKELESKERRKEGVEGNFSLQGTLQGMWRERRKGGEKFGIRNLRNC